MPLLTMSGITKTYLSPAGLDVPVLKGIDLCVEPGETIAVTGPSGSGKSTLLNIMGALDRPTAGTIIFDGEDISQLDDRRLAALRSRKLGFIFQLHHLLPQCTVLENVLVPAVITGEMAQARTRAVALLERVGLSQRISYRPGQLSGGECQRVAVVRALINRPRLLLADEPTGSLDEDNAAALSSLLVELNREENVTLVLVTHSPPLARNMGRSIVLREGRLVEDLI
ncbi:MAG: ABC transporter ATP-binding protein [Lentisphaerales bacterium]|jgi:ABC-type lipoprotein export system ATPase subunit|nr:MAG: ABC transporter ATP-binding protein [Lentisphaerales bacterium]